MLKLLRLFINNGFAVLALLVAVTLYLAYGQKPAASEHAEATSQANSTATETDFIVEVIEQDAVEPEARDEAEPDDTVAQTPAPPLSAPDQTTEQAGSMSEASTPPEMVEATETTEQSTDTAERVVATEAETPSVSESKPADSATATPSTATKTQQAAPESPAAVAKATPQPEEMAENTTSKKPDAGTVSQPTETAVSDQTQPGKPMRGLLFDPAKLDYRAVLSRFDGPQQALAEAHTALRAGDEQWAAAILMSLLEVRPSADIAGTLGNVLWRLGDKTWAHRAWRYAAQLLIREGRIDTARAFARNIRKVDPKLADEIEAHLPQPASAQKDTKQK